MILRSQLETLNYFDALQQDNDWSKVVTAGMQGRNTGKRMK